MHSRLVTLTHLRSLVSESTCQHTSQAQPLLGFARPGARLLLAPTPAPARARAGGACAA
jgi:hypothetical protein